MFYLELYVCLLLFFYLVKHFVSLCFKKCYRKKVYWYIITVCALHIMESVFTTRTRL